MGGQSCALSSALLPPQLLQGLPPKPPAFLALWAMASGARPFNTRAGFTNSAYKLRQRPMEVCALALRPGEREGAAPLLHPQTPARPAAGMDLGGKIDLLTQ